MRKEIWLVCLLALIGCGAEPAMVGPSEGLEEAGEYLDDQWVATKNHVGKKANESREYMADRGFTSEKIGDKVATGDDRVGEQANHARKHLSDRGANSENADDAWVKGRDHTNRDLVNGETYARVQGGEAKDHVGKKANESREYVYTRGIEEMRHGDQDTQDKIRDNERRITELEERVTALEAALASTNSVLTSEVTRLDSADAANLALVQDQLASAMAEILAISNAGDEALAQDLADTEAALLTAIADGDEAVRQELLGRLSALGQRVGNAIRGLQATDRLLSYRLSRLNLRHRLLARKFYRFKSMQERINRRQQFVNFVGVLAFFYLNDRINGLEDRLDNLSISDIDGLQDALDDLGDRITDVEGDVSFLQDELDNLDISDVGGLEDAINDINDRLVVLETVAITSMGTYSIVSNNSSSFNLTCMLGQSVDAGQVVLRLRIQVADWYKVEKVGSSSEWVFLPASKDIFLYSTKGNGTYKIRKGAFGPSKTKACSPL